jgi:HipA-like protein
MSRAPRRGAVLNSGVPAGILEETPEGGYRFTYDPHYLADPSASAVSLTLPRRSQPYESQVLFPFFYGLLAEGSAKALQCRLLKLDENDSFGRLLTTAGADVIGSVTVEGIGE